jgi:hypothetical protein
MSINTSIVTSKASGIVSENFKPSYAVPSAALTPATITAMVGLAKGGALQVAPTVTTALSDMASKATAFGNSMLPGYNPTVASALTSAQTALATMSSKLMPAGNPAAFGQMLMQAQSHINDAIELKSATNFISGAKFGDFGSGVKDMTSITTQGLNNVLGDLPNAAKVMSAAGPLYDMKNMGNFGSASGLVDKISGAKLGKPITDALSKAGVDPTRLNDPVYAGTINKVMGSITDQSVISKITDQFGIKPGGKIENLNDLTDISKIAPSGSGIISAAASSMGGATGTGLVGAPDLKTIATKFSDMGAKFKSPADAATMLKNIDVPSLPNLNAAAPSLNGLMGDLKTDMEAMTGTGNGPMGLPNIKDMLGAATGGPQIDAMNAAIASGDATAIKAAADNVSSMVTKSQSLLTSAGIDIDTPTPKSLGSCMSFAQSLHKMGANTSGSGIVDSLKGMVTNDKYGEAITASLAEGKNKALLLANGIKPPDFTGGNPFAGLPTAASDNSLGAAAKSLGQG